MAIEHKQQTFLKILFGFVFFFSGLTALIYQVAWQRLLTIYYGVGPVSMTLIVSVYMLGLGIGALIGGYLAEKVERKVFLYFFVELLIGGFGLISFSFLNFLGQKTAGVNYFWAAFYQFLFLLVPTLLMGITLPLLTKIFNRLVADFIKTVSFLYFINTLGAAFGAVFASYIAISYWGLDTAIYIAAGLNFVLAAIIYWAASVFSEISQPRSKEENVPKRSFLNGQVYNLVLITGFLAIGYELIWFRFISVLVKHSPYAFSSVLAVYLLGIALGSYCMGRYLAKHPKADQENLFLQLQFFLALCVAIIFMGYYYAGPNSVLTQLSHESFDHADHPIFEPHFFDHERTKMLGAQGAFKATFMASFLVLDVLSWPLVFILIPTLFMGATFPVIAALALRQKDREAKTVGSVYFINVIGNVLGGFVTGFILLPFIGTEKTILVFIICGLGFGWWVTRQKFWKPTVITLIFFTVIFFPEKNELYYKAHYFTEKGYNAYFEEGLDGVVMTYSHPDGGVSNFINGQSHGGRPGYDFYYQVLTAAGFADRPKNVLIIGFGTGSITEAVLKIEGVESVTLVEINKTLLKNLRKLPFAREILGDPKLKIIIDDGRRFLLRSNEKFDLVFMSPLRMSTAYSNNLYSKQFFELVEKNMKSDGILVVWMNKYGVILSTLASVFNNFQLYDAGAEGFMLASDQPLVSQNEFKVGALLQEFSSKDRDNIVKTAEKYTVRDQGILEQIRSLYPPNLDWKPVNEYYLGLKRIEGRFLPHVTK